MDNEFKPFTVGHMLMTLGKLPKPEPPKRKWMGGVPEKCDVCQGEFGKFMVDGRTKMGPWAMMCTACHKQHGCGLGTGNGQKYDRETLEKVAG